MASQYVRLLTRNSSNVSNGVNAVHAATLYELGCIVTLKRNLNDLKLPPHDLRILHHVYCLPSVILELKHLRVLLLALSWIYVLPACVKIFAVHDSVVLENH